MKWQTRGDVDGDNWLRLDPLADAEALSSAMSDTDVVVDLTGVVPRPDADLSVNQALARAVAAVKTPPTPPHVIFASTAAVYGRPSRAARESDPIVAESAYAQAKAEVEQIFCSSGLSVTGLRIGNVAGADALLAPMTPHEGPIRLDQFPDGRSPRRSYIGPATLGDALAALASCAASGQPLPPILNFAAPGEVEMADLLRAASLDWQNDPAPASALPRLTLDTTLLQSLVDMPVDLGDPAVIIQEWRAYSDASEARA